MTHETTCMATGGTALVTGAARRIGRAIALDLAAHGWAVAVHCHRSGVEGQEVVDTIIAGGGRAALVVADLADEAACRDLVAAAEALGGLALLVNNASLFEDDSFETAGRQSWDAHMNANLRAPIVLAQEFVRRLPDGRGGNIINLIDQRVRRLTPKFFSYTLSKAALWTATQTMAQALAPRIRVNAIGPGPVLASTRQSADSFTAQVAAVPLQRRAELPEICAAVRFILETPSMTGQMIALDGGQHLSWRTPDVLVDE